MQTLYRGGLIFDGTQKLSDHALLIEGDRIVRLAPVGEFDGFAGTVADTTGGTVLPGLIDCHVHLCYGAEANPGQVAADLTDARMALKALDHARTTLEGGITAVRDCGGKNHIELAVRDAIARRQVVGPTIRAAGKMICMTGGHGNKFGRIADGADEVIKAVREQIHAGADLIKLMATGGVMTPGVDPEDAHYTEDELRAGVSEGKRFRRRTACHAQGTAGIVNATRAGVDSIEHGIFLTEAAAEEMRQRGTYLVPTLSAVMNILEHADKGIPAWAVEKSRRVAERHRQSIAMYYRLGGPIAMGTDCGTPFNHHGGNARELAYMVEVGMSPV
ncbi:MAG: amidohydrolase family protein, partial [Alphaproteobacteria bacterium]|nr:amidohydrolase family protein [Alphaproteobacteria bacterium]